MKILLQLSLIICTVCASPKLRIIPDQAPAQLLTLPSNATSIRANIEDSFSCEGREYGYYADVENDCQIFHVCLPVTYANGRSQMFRWSFICPEETIFNQEMFTCTRYDESIDCAESPRFYSLNNNFGDDLMVIPDHSRPDSSSFSSSASDSIITTSSHTGNTVASIQHVAEVLQDLAESMPMKKPEEETIIMEDMPKSSTPVFMYHRRTMKG